jgi:hypothetical protein
MEIWNELFWGFEGMLIFCKNLLRSNITFIYYSLKILSITVNNLIIIFIFIEFQSLHFFFFLYRLWELEGVSGWGGKGFRLKEDFNCAPKRVVMRGWRGREWIREEKLGEGALVNFRSADGDDREAYHSVVKRATFKIYEAFTRHSIWC